MQAKDRIIVSLDDCDTERMLELIRILGPHVAAFKFDTATICSLGMPMLKGIIREHGIQAFIDDKLHNTPDAMARASRQQHGEGILFFNVHADAGVEGMKAAVANKGPSKVIAVTLLTTIGPEECLRKYGRRTLEQVHFCAREAVEAGVDGLVCSAQEAPILRADPKTRHLLLVTPGIRPRWSEPNEQKRVTTPADAVRNGADYLVIGRPILNPPKEVGTPVEAARRIAEEIAEALSAP